MVEKFYTKTSMFIDWQQLESLPEIDTLIDIGVGPDGTEDLYRVFKNAKLILIDPIDEAKELPLPPDPEVTRMEFDMKDQMIRNTIMTTQEDVTEIKSDIRRIEEKIDQLK